MRKRILFALGGAGIFVVGLLAGMITTGGFPAFAQSANSGASTASKGDYCALYIQTLASDLKVSQSQLSAANQDAAKKVIAQMYADGKITADQKNRLEGRLGKLSGHPCAFVKQGFAHRGEVAAALKGARQQIETAVAGALNLPVATLESDLAAGQTIPQIAQAQKVDINTVNTAYLNAVKSQLAQAVSSGALTQAQSDTFYSRIQQAATAGHYPLLERHGKASTAPAA